MSKKKIRTVSISSLKRSNHGIEYPLREESALLFNEMLSECGQNKDYIRSANLQG